MLQKIIVSLLLCVPIGAWAESILSFDTHIVVHDDATLSVTETIEYDFGPEERRGIFRYIPIVYQQDELSDQRLIQITDILTTRDGQTEQSVATQEDDDLFILIGHPQVMISGSHVYIISYTVVGAIRYFDDFDEVYWDVTEEGWEVLLNNVTATVMFPGVDFLQAFCYLGVSVSIDTCPSVISGDTVTFGGSGHIGPMTVAAGFSKDQVSHVVFT